MEITTKNGLVYQLDEEMIGDLEVFEALVEIEKGNPVRLPETIKALIGADGYNQLKESVRNEKTGRVKTADFTAAFGEIMSLAGQASPNKKK